jgi:hypothetical protein
MKSFAQLLWKSKVHGKNPLNVKKSKLKWKTIHELVKAIHTTQYFSENEQDESHFPEGSSRAVVKRDVNYIPTD